LGASNSSYPRNQTFDKSYKCVNQNKVIQKETINKHAKILVGSFNESRILVHENGEIINKSNWSKISKLLIKLRSNFITIKESYKLDISIPTILNTFLKIDTSENQKLTEQVEIDSTEEEDSESSEGIDIKERDQHDQTTRAVTTLPELGEVKFDLDTSVIDTKDNIMPPKGRTFNCRRNLRGNQS